MAELVPPGATVAVDELTGAMRDAATGCSRVGHRWKLPQWSARPSW